MACAYETVAQQTTLCGKISGYKGKPAEIKYSLLNPADLINLKLSDTSVEINSDGSFTIELPASQPIWIDMYASYDSNLVFIFSSHRRYDFPVRLIEKGDSIVLHIKSLELENMPIGAYFLKEVEVSGRGIEKFKCLDNLNSQVNSIDDSKISVDYNNVVARLKYDDSVRAVGLSVIQHYKCRLSKMAYTTIKGNFLGLSHYFNTKYITSNGAISDSLRGLYKRHLAAHPEYLDNTDPDLIYTFDHLYGRYVRSRVVSKHYLDKKMSAGGELFPESTDEEYFRILSKMPPGLLREKTIASYLVNKLKSAEQKDTLFSLVEQFLSSTDSNNLYAKQLNEIIALLNRPQLKKGADAYNFALPDTSGKINKMEDFKGKVVVLDFMFTWCPGCRQMTPFMEKVERHFRNNPASFLLQFRLTKI